MSNLYTLKVPARERELLERLINKALGNPEECETRAPETELRELLDRQKSRLKSWRLGLALALAPSRGAGRARPANLALRRWEGKHLFEPRSGAF